MATRTTEITPSGSPDFMELGLGIRPSASVTEADIKTEQQKSSLDQLLKLLSGQVAEGPEGVELTGQESQQRELLAQLMGDTGQASTAALEASQFDAAGIEDLYRTTIRDPLVSDVRENIIPEIAARFGSQFFSSERQGQEGRAIDTLVKTLAGEKNKLIQSERGRQLQALGLFPTIAGTGGQLSQVADIETTKTTAANQRQQELMQLILGGTGQSTFENIATVSPGQEGGIVNFLKGFGEGLGSAAAA